MVVKVCQVRGVLGSKSFEPGKELGVCKRAVEVCVVLVMANVEVAHCNMPIHAPILYGRQPLADRRTVKAPVPNEARQATNRAGRPQE